MTPKYFRTENTNRDRWMISYMDVLTILLIFFVAIAAQRQNSGAASPASRPIAHVETGPEKPNVASNVPETRQTLLRTQHSLEQHGLDLRMEPRGLVISLPQAILFSSGEDQVNRQALPILAQIAGVLRDIPNEVSLVGHADAVPIHNHHFKSNWDLSMARSLRILEVLSHRYGISESRLYLASYGPYRPSGPNDTPDGRARNRRVEIVISGESPNR
jgi:chemotaxis protein MotB